jgi:hypothetical protein
LDLEKSELSEFPLKLGKNFWNICFYNPESKVACLTYLSNVRVNGEFYENSLELVDLQKGTVIDRGYATTLKDSSAGWEKDYLLDVIVENNTNSVSTFYTWHFIKKKSLYFDLLGKIGVLQKYGEGICKVLDIL